MFLLRGPFGLPENIAFSCQNLNFKARFWVREEITKERKKERKEERADRNRSPSTIARTGTFCYSRAWKPLTPTLNVVRRTTSTLDVLQKSRTYDSEVMGFKETMKNARHMLELQMDSAFSCKLRRISGTGPTRRRKFATTTEKAQDSATRRIQETQNRDHEDDIAEKE